MAANKIIDLEESLQRNQKIIDWSSKALNISKTDVSEEEDPINGTRKVFKNIIQGNSLKTKNSDIHRVKEYIMFQGALITECSTLQTDP